MDHPAKKQNAEFVHRMEAVLSVYQQPYQENNPVVCWIVAASTYEIKAAHARKRWGFRIQNI